MTSPHSTDVSHVLPFSVDEAAPVTPPAREISLRAHWLDSLSSDERDCLVDLPLSVVEQRYMDWRQRTHPHE